MRHTIILAGGSGMRHRPWSRAAWPKRLLPLSGGQTVSQIAHDRLVDEPPDNEIL